MTAPQDDDPGRFPPQDSAPSYPSPPGMSPFPPAGQPSYFPPPPPYYPPPVGQYPGGFGPTAAPYGYHPQTGQPLSDKSKTVAGLLQLLGLIGVLGVGRMYIGQTGLGIAQLLIGLFGGFVIGMLTCGIGFLIPVVWGIIDAIILMTGSPRDGLGRPLRDGT